MRVEIRLAFHLWAEVRRLRPVAHSDDVFLAQALDAHAEPLLRRELKLDMPYLARGVHLTREDKRIVPRSGKLAATIAGGPRAGQAKAPTRSQKVVLESGAY